MCQLEGGVVSMLLDDGLPEMNSNTCNIRTGDVYMYYTYILIVEQ